MVYWTYVDLGDVSYSHPVEILVLTIFIENTTMNFSKRILYIDIVYIYMLKSDSDHRVLNRNFNQR